MFSSHFTKLANKLPTLSSFGWGARPEAIDIPSVQIFDTETGTEKRMRTLKHLIKANHANHSIIYNELRFHNHTPHILGSAFCLGGTSEHLHEIYEKETKNLEPWQESPGEISLSDWRDFLGKREYQRAFIDFFEDQLVLNGYDWHQLLSDFLFAGPAPLIHEMLVSGLGHPLIHLAYAYELSSSTLAIEALALGTCFYTPAHAKYLDDPAYTQPPANPSADPLVILARVRTDARFDGLFDSRKPKNVDVVFEQAEEALLEHWNAWTWTAATDADAGADVDGARGAFERAQRAAMGLLVASRTHGQRFDFFLCHLLTSSHAVRVLLGVVPARWHVVLVRQWWLFVLAVYVAQMRPGVEMERIAEVDVAGRGWGHVQKEALGSAWSADAHFVKALRAMKVAAETWGGDEEEQFYLKAALKFADEFDDWGGFDVMIN
ncbi:hypothetical protein EJ05DRAFT_512327 [Pseudovirgaria hyperparasitica]|uniref:MGS207 protein n=1 Tax=Pseudovirgaria hyperparasitica TaxID=470096 RepID=A0A6A6W6K0_9PEZI|nr:uncharacterized protein EJ05DRAFT_512327 [Pseudovirgaria hyperparasitica]KAF2756701.1 hypothetical protein EJ05DRAFT_512327 [Pseudovirgaria hyperparasitica]